MVNTHHDITMQQLTHCTTETSQEDSGWVVVIRKNVNTSIGITSWKHDLKQSQPVYHLCQNVFGICHRVSYIYIYIYIYIKKNCNKVIQVEGEIYWEPKLAL